MFDPTTITQLQGGDYWVPTTVSEADGRFILQFPYSVALLNEIKQMAGRKWHPEERYWSVKDCSRNRFQLAYLSGGDPYTHYEQPLMDLEFQRPLYGYQKEMVSVGCTYRRVFLAADPGLGKSLVSIEIMERSGIKDWYYVGPRSAIASFEVELARWGSKVTPSIMTYERLTRLVDNWASDREIPRGIIFDECQRIKTPTSARSKAALELTEAMRLDDPYILLLSGTPAPKDPTDWWHPVEVACPGFLREGDISKFRHRLAVVKQVEGPFGKYPQLVTWLDDPRKCHICGLLKENHVDDHAWVESRNEVEFLRERTKGVVWIYRKSEHLAELPEIRYRVVKVKPSDAMLRAAKLTAANAESAIQGFTLLRELSDGFQYRDVPGEPEPCPSCAGEECLQCGGVGTLPTYRREANRVPCPKDQVVLDTLEAHEDDGRIVIFAGFTDSVDRVVELVAAQKWEWIRVDGRGWLSSLPLKTPVEMLTAFQGTEHPKIAFISQADAGSTGLTLTASWEILVYSNTFNGEARMQLVHRIHRPGMDINKGAMITDIVHLPTDQLILDNLSQKRRLQDISLGTLVENLA